MIPGPEIHTEFFGIPLKSTRSSSAFALLSFSFRKKTPFMKSSTWPMGCLWLLVTRYSLLVTRCWLRVTGYGLQLPAQRASGPEGLGVTGRSEAEIPQHAGLRVEQ
ncbi:MAG: hypothetical protein JRF52_10955 [Deltaproteobacteria bacterium]|nr:hypothetical protein [Deltaproteobacteria bacterium]